MIGRTRIGVVGINERARRLILPGLVASPRAQVTAVCSRNGLKAQQVAREVARQSDGSVGAFGSVQRMVTSGQIDALYVNTPLEAHVEMCRAAIEAGCGVICEKPLAPTADEAQALTEAAERAGVKTVVNFTYRSVLGFRLTERFLAENVHAGVPLGRPLHARFELLQGHNFMPEFRRGSALLDSGSHLFDLMGALLPVAGFGRMIAVRGEALGVDEPDYGWTFSARTESEVVVSALFSRSALGWRNGLRWALAGEERAVEVEADGAWLRPRAVVSGEGAGQGMWREMGVPGDLAAEDGRFPAFHMDRLVGAVRGEEAFPGFSEAVFANRLAESLAESARSGAWVALTPGDAAPCPPRPNALRSRSAGARLFPWTPSQASDSD
jgi:predicted dehydrogenase